MRSAKTHLTEGTNCKRKAEVLHVSEGRGISGRPDEPILASVWGNVWLVTVGNEKNHSYMRVYILVQTYPHTHH